MKARNIWQIRECVVEKLVAEHFQSVVLSDTPILSNLTVLSTAGVAATNYVEIRVRL
jgi:hypothetical protein